MQLSIRTALCAGQHGRTAPIECGGDLAIIEVIDHVAALACHFWLRKDLKVWAQQLQEGMEIERVLGCRLPGQNEGSLSP